MKNKAKRVIEGFNELVHKASWLDSVKMEIALNGYQPSEIHCIEYIGDHEEVNVTKLANGMFMTRSAISKITRKLLKKELIKSYQKTDNKKEIYFELTSEGQKIYQMHADLHQASYERDEAMFEKISADQYDFILSFLKQYNQHLDEEIDEMNLDKSKFIK